MIDEHPKTPIAFSVFGGNRSGKTQLGAMLTVATAAGRDQPWVRQWLQLNDLPDRIVPNRKPTTVISSALSYGDALTYIRPKLDLFLPADTRFRRWNAQDRAQAYLECGGRIISMSADSGRKRYQGIGGVSLCWLDEEHADYEIFDECLLRTVDTKHNSIGILLTMTPLLGMTWTHEKFLANPSEGFFSYHLTGLDNPYISSIKMMKTIAHMSDESKSSRLHGMFTNQAGMVYPEFDQKIHTIEPFDFSDRDQYQVFLSIDFGVKNPFVCLCCVYHPKTDRLFVVDEYFMTEKTTVQNGHAIQAKFHKYKPFDFVIADPESKDGRLLLARQCQLRNSPAPKSGKYGVIASINLVKERLALDVEGKPSLYIFKDRCKNLRKEFREYRWAKTSNGKDAPKKQNDHGMDAIRYLTSFIHRYNSHF